MNPWYHLCFQVTSIFSIFCVFFTSLKSFEIKYLNFEVIVKGREVVMVSSYNGITNSHFESPELVFLISSRIRSVLFSFSCKFVIYIFYLHQMLILSPKIGFNIIISLSCYELLHDVMNLLYYENIISKNILNIIDF